MKKQKPPTSKVYTNNILYYIYMCVCVCVCVCVYPI